MKKKKPNIVMGILIFLVVIFILFYGFLYINTKINLLPQNIPNIRSDYLITMDLEVAEELNNAYENLNREYFYCLEGYRNGKNITITNAIEPNYLDAEDNYITIENFYPCNQENSIGTIHSHLEKFYTTDSNVCYPSYDDIYAWSTINDDLIINGIQCGNDMFMFYLMDENENDFNNILNLTIK